MGSHYPVFDGFSLSLDSDNIYGLLGKNGMGKSTLLYLICGLLTPGRGSIEIDGKDVSSHDASMLSDMFIVPEEFEMMPVSLENYLKMNIPFYPKFSREILEACLNDFGMTADVNLKELSMGQKKKVYMSFALATNTKYLFMDEPTNGLDIPSKSQFRKVMARSMDEDRTVVISTHQVHDVEQLLDHLLILDRSRLLLDSSVADICDRYTFELRTPAEMGDDVIYAEPSLQGNAVIARKKEGSPDTQLNLELLFNAATKGLIK